MTPSGLHISLRQTLRALALLSLAGLSGCSFLQGAQETSTGVVSGVVEGIRNLPSAVMPAQFERSAPIDSDYRVPNASLEPDAPYTVVRSFFATNRSYSEGSAAHRMFGQGRAQAPTFGKSYVILRRAGDTFAIEPPDLIKVRLGNEPSEPATLSHNEVFDREDFPEELAEAVTESGNENLLLYIHGYNVSFEDAAINSAQLSYDLGFSGTSVFFSWPARGDFPTYVADVESARASERHLQGMLNTIISRTGANRVYIIAHGLGARLTSRVMKDVLLVDPAFRSRLEEIVLVAPDIDGREFRNDLLPYIGNVDSPVTIYASPEDSVLGASSCLRGSNQQGSNAASEFVAPGVESINSMAADTSLSGHAGYQDRRSIIADIQDLFRNDTRANSRHLLTACFTSNGRYWEYRQ